MSMCMIRLKSGPFALSLAYVVEALQNVTPNQDCGLCLSSAKSFLLSTCDGSIGGQVEFVDCSMRYKQYSFS
ncbi:hypothetical protein KY289_019725 [Solanum tuberosum]|nr:hypothetical protein KY289_019725 [Solanum tuberosum]